MNKIKKTISLVLLNISLFYIVLKTFAKRPEPLTDRDVVYLSKYSWIW